MLSLDDCMAVYRPLIFLINESDIEVLKYLKESYTDRDFFVYSTTLSSLQPLSTLIDLKFCAGHNQASSTIEILDSILNRRLSQRTKRIETYVFLDCTSYINDPQVIRKIKDIVTRFQLDCDFLINLIFLSQSINVPMGLERLSEVVFFDLPGEKTLRKAADECAKNLDLKEMPSDEIVNNLKGLTLFEVEQAFTQSYHSYNDVNLDFIRNFKKNSIAKTDLLSLLESNVTFNDIGGMENLKKWIRKSHGGWTVEGKKFGLPLLKGLLMVGLPGTGKSLICKAIGNEWGLPIIAFDPSRIFSSRVGDSESNMRRVLQIVEGISPCVMFIDEVEKSLAGLQSSTFSDSGVTARVIGSFLIWLQECNKPVFTVATANAIQYLPPELISRFDETFFVNLPQAFERQDIFKIHISKIGRDPSKFDLSVLSERSKDLSGREIEQTIREAMYDAYHAGEDLSDKFILDVLSKKTNLLTSMGEQLQYLLTWVGYDEEKGDGIRARFASTVSSLDMDRVNSEIKKLLKDIEK